MHNTSDSPGLIRPAFTNRCVAATVVPPAVSAKIPSVSASNRIPATTSSSLDLRPAACLSHRLDRVKPIRRVADGQRFDDRLRLFTGLMMSVPAFIAFTIGAHPSAWAP